MQKGVVEKEIWLFNTKKTGMQGVNPFEGSSANKGQASRQRLVGVRTGGRGWLSLTIWPFCFGGGGLVRRAVLHGPSDSLKPRHDPPPQRAIAPDRRPLR